MREKDGGAEQDGGHRPDAALVGSGGRLLWATEMESPWEEGELRALNAAPLEPLKRGSGLTVLRQRLGRCDRETLPAALAVLLLDLEARVQAATVDNVRVTHALVDRHGGPSLRAWLSCVVAERKVWQGELAEAFVAQNLTSEVVGDDEIAVMARARLRRLTAFSALASWGDEQAHDQLELARKELESIGLEEELAITDVFFWLARTLRVDGADFATRRDRMADAVRTLERLGSERWALAAVLLGFLCANDRDGEHLMRVLRRLQGLSLEDQEPIVREAVPLLEVVVAAMNGTLDESVVVALFERLEAGRANYVTLTFGLLMVLEVLLDAQESEVVHDLLLPYVEVGLLVDETTRTGFAVKRARASMQLDLSQDAVRHALNQLERWFDRDQQRLAGLGMLRLAADCALRERSEMALWLHERGVDLLDPVDLTSPQQRALIELRLPVLPGRGTYRVTGQGRSQQSEMVRGELRVLCPDLSVWRDGQIVELSAIQARLLGYLIVRMGPVETEWLIEAVWPESEPQTGRNRLKTTLHRLRQTLGIERQELIVRSAHGLALDLSAGWRVDLWSGLADLRGEPQEQCEALMAVDPQVCPRQFRYDDHFELARVQVVQAWVSAGRDCLRAGVLEPVALANRLLELGGVDGALLDELVTLLPAAEDGLRERLLRVARALSDGYL